jgi:hypothetical protein
MKWRIKVISNAIKYYNFLQSQKHWLWLVYCVHHQNSRPDDDLTSDSCVKCALNSSAQELFVIQ